MMKQSIFSLFSLLALNSSHGSDHGEGVVAYPPDIMVDSIDYDDDGFLLTGYVSIPDHASSESKVPAIIFIP